MIGYDTCWQNDQVESSLPAAGTVSHHSQERLDLGFRSSNGGAAKRKLEAAMSGPRRPLGESLQGFRAGRRDCQGRFGGALLAAGGSSTMSLTRKITSLMLACNACTKLAYSWARRRGSCTARTRKSGAA